MFFDISRLFQSEIKRTSESVERRIDLAACYTEIVAQYVSEGVPHSLTDSFFLGKKNMNKMIVRPLFHMKNLDDSMSNTHFFSQS